MNLYDKTAFLNRLSFNYSTMVATETLLKVAIDNSSGKLRAYYEKHLEEEVGHDKMLLDDLERLGVDNPTFFYDAACLAGAQYYLMLHVNPCMLLGYMNALESSSIPAEEIDKLSEFYGTELTCLKHHQIHDEYHAKDLEKIISSLDDEEKSMIAWNQQNVVNLIVNARL